MNTDPATPSDGWRSPSCPEMNTTATPGREARAKRATSKPSGPGPKSSVGHDGPRGMPPDRRERGHAAIYGLHPEAGIFQRAVQIQVDHEIIVDKKYSRGIHDLFIL